VTRGRPPKTSEQLKRDGAKPSIWRARERQEKLAADPAQVQAVKKFMQAMKQERQSWSRRIDGVTLVPCDREPIILQAVKDFVDRMVTNDATGWPSARRFASWWIRATQTDARRGFYFDTLACENVQLWLDTFGIPGSEYSDSDLFVLSNILSWKRPDGSYGFRKSWSQMSAQGRVIAQGQKVLDRI
jgi:hypothetical protein